MKIKTALLAVVILVAALFVAAPAQGLTLLWSHSSGGYGTATYLYTSPWEDTHYYGNVFDASIVIDCDENNVYAHRWTTLDIRGGIGPDVEIGWSRHHDASATWQVPHDTLDIQFVVNSQGCKWTVRLFHP